MTKEHKQEIIPQIFKLIAEIAYDSDNDNSSAVEPKDDKVEMLTVKECTAAVPGLSEHTVRQLVAQNKIPYIRAEQGERGKILINKSDLFNYLNKSG